MFYWLRTVSHIILHFECGTRSLLSYWVLSPSHSVFALFYCFDPVLLCLYLFYSVVSQDLHMISSLRSHSCWLSLHGTRSHNNPPGGFSSGCQRILRVTGDTRVGKVILPAWLATCTHPRAHTHTHRCSLFCQAAINLHARGQESLEGRKERLKVREGL